MIKKVMLTEELLPNQQDLLAPFTVFTMFCVVFHLDSMHVVYCDVSHSVTESKFLPKKEIANHLEGNTILSLTTQTGRFKKK